MLDFKLYAITDRWLTMDLKQYAAEAARHGVRAIRMREADMEPEATFRLATDLRKATPTSKLFLSTPDIADKTAGATAGFAAIVQADGVHFPERVIGNEWTPARLTVSFPGLLFGVSIHSVEAAQRAETWGADFLTFGAVFETPSKRAMGFEPQGLIKLKEVVNAVKVPVFAIGGITPSGARLCLEQGAWGVAVVRDLILAADLGERIAQYQEILGSL
ncbi:MAG TPA: thiamine phosphate synthase, partial [Candidatus Kapabacteria bacterium]|nr:thiamine phosphate synthase [Candidatus Kapabacteria bacterium]